MANPLVHQDLFGNPHSEPTISTFIELQAEEPVSANLVNDLVILSPFSGGKPLTLVRHKSLASIQNLHDPNGNGDQGVALARVAKNAFSDADIFGAARIVTCRVDPSLNAFCRLTDGVNPLIQIELNDYGSRGNVGHVTYGAASTNAGKKIIITDTIRTWIGDNLGALMSVAYTGNGSAAAMTVLTAIGKIAYSGQPSDGDKLTINGVIFEFDNNATVTGGNIAVTIGANMDATFATLAVAIAANCSGVTATADATNNVVTLTALEQGVVMVETLDAGNAVALTHLAPAARLRITLTGATDGSQSLDMALPLSQFRSIQQLAGYINAQPGYTCTLDPYASKFLASAGIDVVSNLDIKTSPKPLTAFVASTVDWVNRKTNGRYLATEIARAEPPDQTVVFAGGATRPVTATDWQNALDATGADLQLGGILLVDTDDPAIFSMVATFIEEQRANGKWFRAFFGAEPGLITDGRDITPYDQIAASLDSERCRMVVQRFGIFRPDTRSIDYLHPIFFAAALAGAAAGNRPFVKPLTNKRLRFAGLHPDDSLPVETREALLEAGITVAKQEADRLVVALAVTTSRDPDRRMARIMSEVDTVDLIDSAVREAFLPFRGQWADRYITGRVTGTLAKVLQEFVDDGALVAGTSVEGEFVPAWRFPTDPPFVINAGTVELAYQVYIGSEIDHIDAYGRATYQRLVGDVSGGTLDRAVTVPRF